MPTFPTASIDRYKDTPAFLNALTGPEYGLYVPPSELAKIDATYASYAVSAGDALDDLAVKFYGTGSEQLWFFIAWVNGIIEPDVDVYPGKVLLIPPRSLAIAYQSRTGNGNG